LEAGAVPRILLLSLLFAAVLADDASGRGAGWRLPLDGPVERGFHTTPAAPYAAGQRRGVDLSGPPGTTVRSACTGQVSFAGRVPGGDGALGVSVRCGVLTATHLGLSSLRVRRGQAVSTGRGLGVLGPAGVLRLGARVTVRRSGYLDPLSLIGGARDLPPLPVGRAPRGRRPVARRRPVALRVPERGVVHAPAPAPAGVPLAAWLGIALLAGGVGCGALVHRDHRRRPASVRGVVREGA